MKQNLFKSSFADEINAYLATKTNAGFQERSFKNHLRLFDTFCVNRKIDEAAFNNDDVESWLEQRQDEATTTHYNRINTIKHFLSYLFLKGYDVVVCYDIRFKPTDFLPHIFSFDEIKRYFKAVDMYCSGYNRKDAIQYPVLFRILYCCGTRLNETLGIRKEDVDLAAGVIKLNESKNNNERYIVLGDDLQSLIKKFADKCFYLLSDDDFIFTNTKGKRLDGKTVYEKHRQFLATSNIPYIGGGKGPRIHDWRHTMAVYSFKQMSDSGLDLYVALPILSAYLGHKTIFATEKYVRLTMSMFPDIEEKFRHKTERVFTVEVSSDETD